MRQPRLSPVARTQGRTPPARTVRLLAVATATLALAACSSLESNRWTNFFMPYKIEVVQGNVVTSVQIVRVTQGMSRTQVREVLGSPLLTDIFHADRWDYIFMLNRPGRPLTRLDVKIFFEGDKVARIEAPGLPTDAEFIDSIDPLRSKRAVPVLALSPEQVKALPVPPPPAVAASAPQGPQRSYPPLEPRG